MRQPSGRALADRMLPSRRVLWTWKTNLLIRISQAKTVIKANNDWFLIEIRCCGSRRKIGQNIHKSGGMHYNWPCIAEMWALGDQKHQKVLCCCCCCRLLPVFSHKKSPLRAYRLDSWVNKCVFTFCARQVTWLSRVLCHWTWQRAQKCWGISIFSF